MKKVLILANHFIVVYCFRKELLEQLLEMGCEVYVSTVADEQNKVLTDMGCKVIETEISRRGINALQDIKLIFDYKKIMRKVKPDIIFSYTVKPNVYGSMASNSLGFKQICNITGTGATFLKESFLSRIVRTLYRISVKKAYKVFFQNTGDMDYFVKHKLVNQNISLLPGSGVNLEQYTLSEMPADDIVNFIFIGRVMGVKGVEQYLECAKAIKSKYQNTCFYVAGFIEEDKYKSIIDQYHEKGFINYIGFQKNIGEWINKCHCTILPSLGGEGVPNVLLESAAKGRVCIASRINGSKDVVDDGVTGYLFDTGSSDDLTIKVEEFLKLSLEQKRQMGLAGRERVERQFDRRIVVEAYVDELKEC